MDSPVGQWIILPALILLAFLITLAQTALRYANENKIAESARGARAEKLMLMMDAPRNPLLALRGLKLFLLMLFSVLCTQAFQGGTLPRWLTGLLCCLAGAFLGMTLCNVLAEKLAKKRAEAIALRLYPLMAAVHVCMLPLVFLSKTLARFLMAPLGLDPKAAEEEVTQEEILALVDIGEESGIIESDEHEMLKNVFDFGDLTAADCMTHRIDVTAIHLEDSDEDILETIRSSGLSRFPVYQDSIDDVVGVLATRDFLLNLESAHPRPLRQMLREPYFVPETVPNGVLLRNMQKGKNHLAIVVDEYGGMSGIITLEDLLEEIVGNIYDEFDPATETEIEKCGENEWLVSGTAEMEALEEALQVRLPVSEDYDTLGGLVFSRLSVIPEDGTQPEVALYCTEDGLAPREGEATAALMKIRVVTMEDRRVEKARISLLWPESRQQNA